MKVYNLYSRSILALQGVQWNLKSMTGKLPVLVFDLGGVLLDWNPHHLYDELFHGDTVAADDFLTEIGFAAWNARQDAGYPFAKAVAEHSLRFPHWSEMIQAYDTRWMDMLRGAIQPCVELLQELKQSGFTLWVLSNWSPDKFRLVRPMHPFLEQMDGILISGEVGIVKPDERIYLELLRRVRQPARECLFIDDSPANVAAARRLGFQTILFESTEGLKIGLKRFGIATSPGN